MNGLKEHISRDSFFKISKFVTVLAAYANPVAVPNALNVANYFTVTFGFEFFRVGTKESFIHSVAKFLNELLKIKIERTRAATKPDSKSKKRSISYRKKEIIAIVL